MLDFGALPPEINSGRMYAGPGPGSLLMAAAAWQALAAGLMASGAGMAGTTGALVAGSWMGPSSMMMGISSASFVAWVLTTAANAEKAAAMALGAVDAHATAFAATIPPEEVTRNQVTTATLIATNFLGVNSAAIAASQAQYEEYWAQDASAMYGYAAENQAIAASLAAPPFLPAIPNTDPAGLAAQAGAAADAAGQSAGQAAGTASQAGGAASQMGGSLGGLSSMLSAPAQMMGAVPQALQQLSQPFSQAMQPLSQFSSMLAPLMRGFGSGAGTFGSLGSLGSLSATATPGGGSFGTGMMGPVTAAMGRSGSMGSLSAPMRYNLMQENWADATPRGQTSALKSFTPEGFVAPGEPEPGVGAGGVRGVPPMAMMPPMVGSGQQGGMLNWRQVQGGANLIKKQTF